MDRLLLVFSTCPQASAADLAHRLVEKKLAACVNILPSVRSVYAWQGEICDDAESLLLIKTPQSREAELFSWLQDEHPYEVPEIVSLAAKDQLLAYWQWVLEQTQA